MDYLNCGFCDGRLCFLECQNVWSSIRDEYFYKKHLKKGCHILFWEGLMIEVVNCISEGQVWLRGRKEEMVMARIWIKIGFATYLYVSTCSFFIAVYKTGK